MGGDLPDYSRKVILVYEGTVVGGEVLCDHRKILGIALKTPTTPQCLPVSVEHVVGIDHQQIKGLTLKDPLVPLCVPVSIEGPFIGYEPCLDAWKIKILEWPADVLAISLASDWTRELGQVDLARVLGVTLSHSNPVISRLTNGSAFIDPRDRSWTITENLARSWVLGATDIPDLSDRAARLLGVIANTSFQVSNFPSEYGLPASQVTDLKVISGTATVTQVAKDRTVTGTLTQSTKHDAQTFLSARIDTATGTTNVSVVAAQGAGNKIYVVGYQLQGKGDVEAVLRSASTDLSPEWDFNAREGVVAPICVWPAFYFVTAANEALNIYLDAAIRVTGNVQYVVGT